MNMLMRLIPHEHEFIPIIYGLLMKTADREGNIIPPVDYYEGGCVVKDEKFICKICGKMVIDLPMLIQSTTQEVKKK